jgi:thiamine-monophosphate kinase
MPTSMIDVSDGLSSEVLHLCRNSNTGCVLYEEKIPIHDDTRAIAMQFGISVTTCALSGGEDYELLFTIKQEDYEKMSRNYHVSIIGYMTDMAEGKHLITKGGNKHVLTAQGWNAFE